MKSPTQQSLKLLRDRGWTCEVTEHFNIWSKRRVDFMGFCDIWAMSPTLGGLVAVQTTTTANVPARIAKIKAEPRAALFMACGGKILVQGWAKRGPRGKRKVWSVRETWL